MNGMTFIDLFSGIGGFRLGLEALGMRSIGFSEIDHEAVKVYKDNFDTDHDIEFGDISKIDFKSVPHVDIVTAGFPCQPFSISGKKKGFLDERGKLFFNICEFVLHSKPKVIILENVKHLIYHNKKRTLSNMLDHLESMGYKHSFKVLNSVDFGVPQSRERLIIIASQKKRFHFNIGGKNKNLREIKIRDFLEDSPHFEWLKKNEFTIIKHPVVQKSGLIFSGYRNKNTFKKCVRLDAPHLSRMHRQPNRIYSVEGIHPTIPSQEFSGRFFIFFPESKKVRKLTLRECYSIMGFPKHFKFSNNKSQAYKQIGNSICVPMVKAIGQEIIKQEVWSERVRSDFKESFQPEIQV